jgi:hypothetical protein
MKALHVICRRKPAGRIGVQRLDGEPHVFVSDAWVKSGWTPETIIGARLYMHQTQATPSEFGGEIIGCDLLSPKGAVQPRDRYRLIFKATHDSRGVKWRGNRGQTEQGGLIEA